MLVGVTIMTLSSMQPPVETFGARQFLGRGTTTASLAVRMIWKMADLKTTMPPFDDLRSMHT